MRVHGETTTLAAVRYFQSDNNVVNKTLQNLSSGKRITSAADDAAGLAVSQKLVAHIKGFNQANRNIQDGFSMLQTAEGGLEELTSMLQRMRILAVQSTNGTLSDEDRNLLNEEVTQLRDEIQRTAETVNFNGLELLTGYINWQELEIDPTKTNVCDAGLVGNADFGIYDVHLDISAVEQQQTSGIKTGTFVENEGLNSGTDTMANATVAAGKYVYSGGNWLTDFSSINIEMMHKLTADGTNLKEGTDFTYTNSSNGVNESTGILNLIGRDSTTTTINNENVDTVNATTVSVDYVIANNIQTTINNVDIGDTLRVTDIEVSAATTGTATIANSKLTTTLDTETKIDDTTAVAGAIAGSTQTIDVAAANADMQTAAANLTSFNITSIQDSSVQMTGFTTANNGFTGNQSLDTVLSGNTSTVDATGKVIVGQTTGTFTNNSLTVGRVTVTDAIIQGETITEDSSLNWGGVNPGKIVSFTVSGSNVSATKLSSFVSDSQNFLQNDVGNLVGVQNGAVGSYFYDNNTGVFTAKIGAADDITTSTINYKANWQWSAVNTVENADNSFNLAAQTTGKGGTLTFTGLETVTYNDNITYHDDEYESIDLDSTGKITGTNFVVTGDNDVTASYGLASDYYNESNDTKDNTLVWAKDDIGFATNFSVDYTYGIDYSSAGFTVAENLDGTVDITKTSGNTTSQFMDTANGDSSFKMSYNYKDQYVNTINIVNPGNLTNSNAWGVNMVGGTVSGYAGASVNQTNGSVSWTNEEYTGNITLDYQYDGKYNITAIDRDSGEITFGATTGNIAAEIGDLVSAGTSTVQLTYNTFKDNVTATWYELQKEAILSSAQLNASGEQDDFTTPYVASNLGTGTADPGTPSSLKITSDGTNWLTYGTLAQVQAGTADYTVEGKSIKFKDDALAATAKAYYVTDTNTNNTVSFNLGDRLGNAVGAADTSEYTTANQGIFKGFNTADKISFTIDGRQIDIDVNPSDTVGDLINRINTIGNSIYLGNSNLVEGAYMGTGNSNNAGIWAELSGNQILISSRDNTNNYGYKGTRFEITVNDAQIGAGTFLNFVETQAAVDPTVTVIDSDGNNFTSTSSDGSNFFNNNNEVQGIPGVRIQLKEDAAAGTQSKIELMSYALHVGADANQKLGLNMIDVRAGALGLDSIDVSTRTNAEAAITTIDNALDKVINQRATLGAAMNRLEKLQDFNSIASENITNAESRISDTDFAQKMVDYTKGQIMTQSSLSAVMKGQQHLRESVLNIFQGI